MKSYRRHPGSGLLALLTVIAAVLTFAMLAFLIVYILVKGIPYLSADLFSPTYTSENVSLVPSLINTFIMTGVSLLIAAPLGILRRFILWNMQKGQPFCKTDSHYRGNPFGNSVYCIRPFRHAVFCRGAEMGDVSALRRIYHGDHGAAPDHADSGGSLEICSGFLSGGKLRPWRRKLRTIFTIVLPSAVPGILAGVILAIGRVVGETAALIYTAGTVAAVPDSLMGSGRTLALHMYVLSSEGLHMNQASATAVVILAFVLLINGLSGMIAKRMRKDKKE